MTPNQHAVNDPEPVTGAAAEPTVDDADDEVAGFAMNPSTPLGAMGNLLGGVRTPEPLRASLTEDEMRRIIDRA
jgi:hypothetical protein